MSMFILVGVTTLSIPHPATAATDQVNSKRLTKEQLVGQVRGRILFSTLLYIDSLNTVSGEFKEFLKQEKEEQEALRSALTELGVGIVSVGLVGKAITLINKIPIKSSVEAYQVAILAQQALASKPGEKLYEQVEKKVSNYLGTKFASMSESSAINVFFNEIKDLAVQQKIVLSDSLDNMSEEELKSVDLEYNGKDIRLAKYLANAGAFVERYKEQVLPISYENSFWGRYSLATKAFLFLDDRKQERVGLVRIYDQGAIREEKTRGIKAEQECTFLRWVSDDLKSTAKFKMKAIFHEDLTKFSRTQAHRIPGAVFDDSVICGQLLAVPYGVQY